MIDETTAVELIKDWYFSEPQRNSSRIGIPNAGLHVLELMRKYWPLRRNQYLTRGGGQVAGLSGPSGDIIVTRYRSDLESMGSEAGRTSRSTPGAATRLADLINGLPGNEMNTIEVRLSVASIMQEWIVENILADHLAPAPLRLKTNTGALEKGVMALINQLENRSDWTDGVSRLVEATIRSVFSIDDDLPTVATKTGPLGVEISLPSMRLLISAGPTTAVLDQFVVGAGGHQDSLLLVPERRVVGTKQLLDIAGHLDQIEVWSPEQFVAQIVRCASLFNINSIERNARLIEHALMSSD